jgi:hypothetical protein
MSKPEDQYKYLPGYATEEQVKARSNEIAIAQGYSHEYYYFGWIKKPFANEWAMVIVPPQDEAFLTESERGQIVSRLIMENDGWFPEPPLSN